MADITYGVNVEYLSTGNLTIPSSVKDLEKGIKTDKISKGLFNAASGFASGINDALNIAAIGFGVLGVGAVHALKTGLVEMNAEVEQMAIGMAAMFSSHGNVDNFNEGLQASRDLIVEMRKDARQLPGEFKDLSLIMSTMATPALRNGMSIRETEKLAANAMASGMTHSIAPSVIGREMAAILSGAARSNMPMLNRGMLNLHVGAKELNAMPLAKRMETINKALGLAGGPEAEAMANMKKAHMDSWIGLTSTIRDQVKQILGTLSYHLFERIKGGMHYVSDWFSTNQDRIIQWADKVGWTLANGFTYAFHQLSRLEPLFVKFSNFMGKEATLGKLPGDIGKLVAGATALKLATAIAPTALEGAGALVGGEGALAGVGAALGLGATGTLTAALTGLGVVLVALAGFATIAYGAIEGLANMGSPLNEAMTEIWHNVKVEFYNGMQSLKGAFDLAWPVIQRFSEIMGASFLAVLEAGMEAFALFAQAILGLFTVIKENWDIVKTMATWAFHGTLPTGILDPDTHRSQGRPDPLHPINSDLDRHMKPEVPNHTTHIHKVEIKVNSNQDPNRIAKAVHGILRSRALAGTPAGAWAGNKE